LIDALKKAWIFYSIVITAVIAIFFLMPEDTIINRTPVCGSIAASGTECFACGMTMGFGSISEFDIDGANAANRGAVFVFMVFLLNTIIFARYITIYINKKKHQYRKV
jgi:hypothetical protein